MASFYSLPDDEDESVFEPKERVGASEVATDSLAAGNDANPVDPEPKVCLGAGADAPAPPKKAPKSLGAPASGAAVSSGMVKCCQHGILLRTLDFTPTISTETKPTTFDLGVTTCHGLD